ncbi:extracellular solute-binding protein [Actinoplanes derwentensis]|uniref:Raffinose/stachyose/melibiose transport system substrate-binding protein n=1 Tax=Actinoplanes derwentensis TaxID=113562 RepID=A0A1H2AEC7_9ACTN|nr:extracellular solute-binding protein [Actinoplanes derwentensis]GID88234.1 sugar ABC transporter substrate-binding protein [Actinoplanes derwentensis]SDT44341.1 raffinose/stachyose/melibiose transport system substrate-binding protein [Actinoplanes derwentensis]
MFRSRSGLAAGALLLAVSLGLTACGGDESSSEEGADAKVLNLWHYEGPESAMGIAWNKSIELFKASHPGVEVKFEEKGFEQIQQNAQMILNSDSAPDILEYNKGNATAGLLSKQGLLTDLSDEFTKRGWDKKLSASLQTTAKYDEDGIMGSGKVFGVPNYGEFVTVYYNKKLFDKYKLAVPTTLDEFTKVMDTFVQNKVTPLAVGGAEYPAQQIVYELALSKADRAFVDDYQLYKNKVDFKGPQLTYAAQTFADWVSKGYVGKDSAGIKAEDMGVSFTKGEFPILISGSWWYGRFASEIKDFEWGTFLFPGNTLHPGSSGNLWVVPEKSKAKALAYDFIDITMSPEVQALLGNSGGVPVAADPSAITDPKNKELVETFNKISTSDGLAFYPDWPAPGYYDVLVAGTQGLINGSKTPDAFLDEIAKPYNENLADLGK